MIITVLNALFSYFNYFCVICFCFSFASRMRGVQKMMKMRLMRIALHFNFAYLADMPSSSVLFLVLISDSVRMLSDV